MGKRNSKIKATLTLVVHFEDESGTMSDQEMMAAAKSNLEHIAQNAASNGMMSGDSEMTVETWDSNVETQRKQD